MHKAFACWVGIVSLSCAFSVARAEQTEQEITTLLTTGQWFFQGQNWSNLRTFKPDHTFLGRKNGTWKIENGMVVLVFVDHEDKMILPLDPKGTKGMDANGLPFNATQQLSQTPAAAAAAPAVASGVEQTEDEINALFTSGQWHFQGVEWGNDREFKADKTFTGGGADGTWKKVGNQLILTANGKEMQIFLPLDPKGTKGLDSRGSPVVINRVGETQPPKPVRPPGFVAKDPNTKADLSAAPPASPLVTPPPKPAEPVPPEVLRMLTQGQWYIQGMNWSQVRVFKQDGTFTTQRDKGQDGNWRVEGNTVVLAYRGVEDKISLPLNPDGSKGVDSKGNRMIALRQPLVEPTPPVIPPAEIRPVVYADAQSSKQTPEEIAGLLTVGQWFFQGKSWANVRVFKPDGTFKGGGDGTWKVENGKVIVDSKGKQDNFFLPVKIDGTVGIDSKGIPFVAFQQPLKPLPAKMIGSGSRNNSAQTDETIKAILFEGQWFFQGRSWANVRVFRPDGTFFTQNRPGEGGTWKIIDGMVVISIKATSNENQLMFPIDPQLTIGQDPEGIPIIIFQQPLSQPTPTPTPPPALANGSPRPAGSPLPKSPATAGTSPAPKPAAPANGGTPAYFGTQQDHVVPPPPQ